VVKLIAEASPLASVEEGETRPVEPVAKVRQTSESTFPLKR
jgi:hypothetical protein